MEMQFKHDKSTQFHLVYSLNQLDKSTTNSPKDQTCNIFGTINTSLSISHERLLYYNESTHPKLDMKNRLAHPKNRFTSQQFSSSQIENVKTL